MAEGKTFHLEIVTPDKQFFIGEADSLILPALDGSMVGQGLAEIMPDRAIVLVSAAERPEEIDLKRAAAARERAEERLKQKLSMRDYYNSKAALARAMARLKAGRKKR